MICSCLVYFVVDCSGLPCAAFLPSTDRGRHHSPANMDTHMELIGISTTNPYNNK